MRDHAAEAVVALRFDELVDQRSDARPTSAPHQSLIQPQTHTPDESARIPPPWLSSPTRPPFLRTTEKQGRVRSAQGWANLNRQSGPIQNAKINAHRRSAPLHPAASRRRLPLHSPHCSRSWLDPSQVSQRSHSSCLYQPPQPKLKSNVRKIAYVIGRLSSPDFGVICHRFSSAGQNDHSAYSVIGRYRVEIGKPTPKSGLF
jgi:hypothetical protein